MLTTQRTKIAKDIFTGVQVRNAAYQRNRDSEYEANRKRLTAQQRRDADTRRAERGQFPNQFPSGQQSPVRQSVMEQARAARMSDPASFGVSKSGAAYELNRKYQRQMQRNADQRRYQRGQFQPNGGWQDPNRPSGSRARSLLGPPPRRYGDSA